MAASRPIRSAPSDGRSTRSNGCGRCATTCTTTPHALSRSVACAEKASKNGRLVVDDIVHRLRKASVRDVDIYRIIHAAAHHIEQLEVKLDHYTNLHQTTHFPAEGHNS